MNIDALMFHIMVIAKTVAPFDTGNLAINSIDIFKTPEGFKLVYSGTRAPYVEYLEYGTSKSNANKDFIDVKTRAAIVRMLKAVYHGDYTNLSMNFKILAERAKGNAAIDTAFLQQFKSV